jgi:uncharacterized protein YbbC (DUF1343 family)
MKKTIIFILIVILLPLHIGAQNVKTGIEVLKSTNFKSLEGKRVGLITNPTGVDNNMRSTADILFEAPNVRLVALYGPEHGIRGDAHAGDEVGDQKDPKTGLPLYSLYGKSRKATPDMLKDIDVLVYDIQDNGSRSYTYISTMGLAMEAAAENNIEFMVLDRPNPLGGKIEGCLVEDGFISFVSQYKIPYLYGMTCGELARYLNGEKMISKPCKLTVIKMEGWKRNMSYEQTGLQWIPPSPHIPHPYSSHFYAMTGILGELYYVSIGVGYTTPFQIFAAEWIDAEKFADNMNALKIPGVIFRPIHIKPFYSTSAGVQIHGVQIHVTDYIAAPLTDIQFYAMQVLYEMYPQKAIFGDAAGTGDRFRMFDQVCGSDYIRLKFSERYKFDDIKAYWYKDVENFREKIQQYLLYK